MSSNLRAKEISGFVTDSAGNVLRNSQIVIKSAAPNGSYIVDSAVSDEDGFFTSKPIPNGIYDIYESGLVVAKTIHVAQQSTIQSFATGSGVIPADLPIFNSLDEQAATDINKFKFYIQMENADLNIQQYGHIFPVCDILTTQTTEGDLITLASFHGLTTDSRLTTTRFDVEYFNPLTALNSAYRRIRWVGIPGIQFYPNSPLVLPLDFYSIRINRPAAYYEFTASFQTNETLNTVAIYVTDNNANFTTLANNAVKGDICKLTFDSSEAGDSIFYGIFIEEDEYSGYRRLNYKVWRSSNYTSASIAELDLKSNVTGITVNNGLFNGITSIGTSTSERFTVTENVYAQDVDIELFNYSNV